MLKESNVCNAMEETYTLRKLIVTAFIAVTAVLPTEVDSVTHVRVLVVCDSPVYANCESWVNATFPRTDMNTTLPQPEAVNSTGTGYIISGTLVKGGNLFTENIRELSNKADVVATDYVVAIGDGPTVDAASCVAEALGVPALIYSTSRSRSVIYKKNAVLFNPTRRDLAKAVATLIGSQMAHNSYVICQDSLAPDGFIGTIIDSDYEFSLNISQYGLASMSEGDEEIQVHLLDIYDEGYRLIVVHATPVFLKRILRIADTLNYLRSGYAWIVTETALEPGAIEGDVTNTDGGADTADDLFLGFLAVQGYEVDTYDAIFSVMVDAIEQSVETLVDGADTRGILQRNVQDEIREISHSPLMFNGNGSRTDVQFRVMNYVHESVTSSALWKAVGYIKGSNLDLETVVWPGHTIFGPVGTAREHYTVVMRPAEPFMFVRGPVPSDDECVGGTVCLRMNTSNAHIVKETLEKFRSNQVTYNQPQYDMFCCDGIVVDILHSLSADLNFDFILYFQDNNNYGTYSDGEWTGMVGDVYNGVADFMVGAISVTSERLKAISFTEPFYYSYFNMISANTERRTSMFAFIQPFELLVWCLITVSATVTALATSLLEWNSPFGLNPSGRGRPVNYTLGTGLTMVYSIWFGHTVSTQPPKSWPSKVVQNFWAAAAIVIVASYTAFLAAYLAGNAYSDSKYSILDTQLSSKRVGVMQGTAVEDFTSVINSGLADQLPNFYVNDVLEALTKLRSKSIDLYMDDTPLLEYALSKFDDNCTFKYSAYNFGENAYAFGFPKDSWLKEKINPLLLNYVELGYVDGLKVRYMGTTRQCSYQIIDSMEFKFGLEHTEGLFVMLLIAIGISCILLAAEHALYFMILPRLRRRPSTSIWKKRNLEFISQRLYRSINSEKVQHPATKLVDKVRIHQSRLKNRLLRQRTRSMPMNLDKYRHSDSIDDDVPRGFSLQNFLNHREDIQINNLSSYRTNNIPRSIIEEADLGGCSNPVFEDDAESVRSDIRYNDYMGSNEVNLLGLDTTENCGRYCDGSTHNTDINCKFGMFAKSRKVKRHETWPSTQTPNGSLKRAHNNHQRSASTTDDNPGHTPVGFHVLNEKSISMHKCNSCSAILQEEPTPIARNEFGIKDNRLKDDLRNHAMAAYSSITSIGLDNCAVESLSKEDLLVMWKRSEIELQTKLNRTMYQNLHLKQIIHVIEEAADGRDNGFARNSARSTTL